MLIKDGTLSICCRLNTSVSNGPSGVRQLPTDVRHTIRGRCRCTCRGTIATPPAWPASRHLRWHRLLRVLHTAVRIVTGLGPIRDHIAGKATALHWLPIEYRITYRLYVSSRTQQCRADARDYIREVVAPLSSLPGWEQA